MVQYSKFTYATNTITSIKKKKYKIISISMKEKKAFICIIHIFMVKCLHKTVVERNIFNLRKGVCRKPTVNITLDSERLDYFILSLGKRH